METKRILVINEDPFLNRFYREKLREIGYSPLGAGDLAQGMDAMESTNVDLVVLDPLLPGSPAARSIEAMRSRTNGHTPPFLVLPTQHHWVGEELGNDSHVRLLTHVSDPLGELLKASADILSEGKGDEASRLLAALPNDAWRSGALDAVRETHLELRRCVHELSRNSDVPGVLDELLRYTHRLSGQTPLLSRSAIGHLAAAMEVMVYSLDHAPNRLNANAMRTLGQAADFLGVILQDDVYSRVPDAVPGAVSIIEDEKPARELISAAVDLVGLKSHGAGSPAEAIDLLCHEHSDLIFLDINLPEMNGFDLCSKIRALPLHERTPIVFLTGMGTFQNRVQSNLSGGNDFITKPFNVSELGLKALLWVMKGKIGTF